MNCAIAENDLSMEVNEYDLMLVHGGSGGGGGAGGSSGYSSAGAHGAGGTGEPQPYNVGVEITGNDISMVGTVVSFFNGRAGAVIAAVGQAISYVSGY